MKWLTLKNQADPAEGVDIYIYDTIDSMWGFSSKDLVDALQGVPADAPVAVHINSVGGQVTEGLAIYNLLNSRSNVTTIVEGAAASIASVIFMAGDERKVYAESIFMMHLPHLGGGGNEEDLKAAIELLQKVKRDLTNIYSLKSNLSAEEVEEILNSGKDVFLSSDEVLEKGFATSVISSPELVAAANLEELVAKLNRSPSKPRSKDMKFEAWLSNRCEPLGLNPSELSKDQLKNMRAEYDKLVARRQTPPAPPASPLVDLEAQRKAAADEADRVSAIEDAAQDFAGVKFNEEHLKTLGCKGKTVKALQSHAIRNGWTVDKFELEARRAEMPEVGHVGIHRAPDRQDALSNTNAIQVALLRNAGVVGNSSIVIPGLQNKRRDFGFEHQFSDEDLEASHNPHIRDMSLLQMFNLAHQRAHGYAYQGRLNTDAFLKAARESLHTLRAQNSTWGGLQIFEDVANKALLAAYNSIPTTWQEWVHQKSVSDFKTSNLYRLTMKGSYQKIAPGGRIKHGGFDDDKFTHSADTFGKIVGLDRRDMINDDLGALNTIMTLLGVEGAKFLEELFYVHLLNNLTTLFPTNDANANYIDGAGSDLGVDGLTLAEQKLTNQVDSDNAPLLFQASILLHGTVDGVLANELYTKTNLQGVQTANAKKRPDGNPHVGKYRPVESGYLNNTAIKQRSDANDEMGKAVPNQTDDQWLLLGAPNDPRGGIVIGSFLGGRTTPFVEQADQSFDVLGMQWRAYHDAGSDNGDPKMAVYSKGAA